MAWNFTVTIDDAAVNGRVEAIIPAAYRAVKRAVMAGCDPYVPYDTGRLARSAAASAEAPDAYLVYDAPYARHQYYSAPSKNPEHHPNATMMWLEAWRAAGGAADLGPALEDLKVE